jgi:hypothetical protein
MSGMRLTGGGVRGHPDQPQLLHEALDALPINAKSAIPQKADHAPTAQEGMACVFFIDQSEHHHFVLTDRLGMLMRVIRGTTHPG